MRPPKADHQAEWLINAGEFAQFLAGQVGDELLLVRFRGAREDAGAVHELPGRWIVQDNLLPLPLGGVDVVFDLGAGVAKAAFFGVTLVFIGHINLAVIGQAPAFDAVIDGQALAAAMPFADVAVAIAGPR